MKASLPRTTKDMLAKKEHHVPRIQGIMKKRSDRASEKYSAREACVSEQDVLSNFVLARSCLVKNLGVTHQLYILCLAVANEEHHIDIATAVVKITMNNYLSAVALINEHTRVHHQTWEPLK